MNWIKYISTLFIALSLFCACDQDNEVGYLLVDGAGYSPDSLNVRIELDPILDSKRMAKKVPWFSTSIQGVEGTSPLSYSLADVYSEDGDVQSIIDNVEFKGIGVIYIPFENSVKEGRYTLSVKISNVYGEKVIKDAFTIIVD